MKASINALLKVGVFISLAVLSFNVYAYHHRYYHYYWNENACCENNCYSNNYIGNPNRPYTMWVPGHYTRYGCWVEGHYVKFLRMGCGCMGHFTWSCDRYVYSRPMVVVGTLDTF